MKSLAQLSSRPPGYNNPHNYINNVQTRHFITLRSMQGCSDHKRSPHSVSFVSLERFLIDMDSNKHQLLTSFFRATKLSNACRRSTETAFKYATTHTSSSPHQYKSTARCVSSVCINPQPRQRYMQTAPGIMNSRTEVAHLAVALYALEKCRI